MSKPYLAACLAACSSFACAQTVLPTQIVTASRLPESVDQTLASVQVIDRATLDQHPSQDIGEILRYVAGIDAVRSGGPGGQISLFTRGTESNHTLVLIDGVRINSATSSQASIQHLSSSAIERIEIVRGPLSSLYGSEAIGGVVNIITRKADSNRGELSINAGSRQFANASLAHSIRQGNFDSYLEVDSQYNNGYRAIEGNDATRGQRLQGINLNSHYTAGQTALGLQLHDHRGLTEYTLQGYPPPAFTATDLLVSQDFHNQVLAADLNIDITEQWNSVLRLSQMLDEIDQKQSTDQAHTRQRQADWQNTFSLGEAGTVLGGLNITNMQALYNAVYEHSRRNKAVYLQYQWQAQGFSTQASVRRENYDSFGSHTTGSLALGYALTANHRLYANAGTAFKAPDLNELYDSSYGSNNPNLKPEESRSVEIGSRHHLGSFELGSALFRNRLTNLISYDKAFKLQNFAQATTQGLELNGSWRNTVGCYVNTRASYVRARDDDRQKDLDRRPRRQFTVETGYAGKDWGTSLGILASSQASDFSNQRLRGYAVSNLQSWWQVAPQVRVRLNLENLGGARYGTAYYDTGRLYLATPFTATVGATLGF